jgi:hypothetical protein
MGRTQGGKEQLGIQWTLEGGETIWSYHYFSSPKALDITVDTLQAIGWDPIENGWALDSINGPTRLVGQEAQLVLAEDEYEGKVRVRVQFVNNINGGGGLRETMTEDEVKAFVAGLRQRAGVSASDTVWTAPSASAPDEDDKVPF